MSNSLARATLARQAARLNAASGNGRLPSLILLTDDERLPDPLAAASALPRGSAIIVRARNKEKRFSLGIALREIAHGNGLFLVVADDPQLAVRVYADGIHLPEKRAQEAMHWRATHPDWFITCTAHSMRAAANVKAADAVLLSPIFATQSHPERAPLTPMRLRFVARNISVPIYALGGIDASNVLRLRDAPLAGIAAISSLKHEI